MKRICQGELCPLDKRGAVRSMNSNSAKWQRSAEIALGAKTRRSSTARASTSCQGAWYDPCDPEAFHSEDEIRQAYLDLNAVGAQAILDGDMF